MKYVYILAIALLLVACGGGGGGSTSATNTTVDTLAHGVGGTVSGLVTGNVVVLESTNFGAATVTANGPYVFPTKRTGTNAFVVKILSATPGLSCTIRNAENVIVSTNDITNINLDCGSSAHGTFMSAARLNYLRFQHTATLLTDGRVLVAGGWAGSPTFGKGEPQGTDVSEIYDPLNDSWTLTGAETYRFEHTATLLANGKVLVVGGNPGSYNPPLSPPITPLASAELFDPATKSWTATSSLRQARLFHTATLLPNGNVLVVGGVGNTGNLSSAELYNPTTQTWTNAGVLSMGRYDHTSNILPSGKVLVSGGTSVQASGAHFEPTVSEVYDPASNSWSTINNISNLPLGAALVQQNGSLLARTSSSPDHIYRFASFDTQANTWSMIGQSPKIYGNVWTLMPNGQILMLDGDAMDGTYQPNMNTSLAGLYDPTSNTSKATGNLINSRDHPTSTLLKDGRVLVIGGYGPSGGNLLQNGGAMASAELYFP